MGIIGFGRIGQAVAARAPAFGMRVAYTGRGPKPGADGEFMPLDRLLSTSDVVSLHCPLTPETKHLINQTTLARMKRSAYLISAARGPVVDEAALVWALENRLIAGAALDVYEKEPEIHKGLLGFENVVLSPHLGSSAIETRTTMIQLAAQNIIAVFLASAATHPDPDLTLLGVPVDGLHRKRRQAYRDVFGTPVRRAVANPLAGRCDDSLSSVDVDHAVLVLDADGALQHDRDLLELRPLPGLVPSRRRDHARDAHRGMSGVDAAGVSSMRLGGVPAA